MRGDIYRLISLCTPHYSSDLPQALVRLRGFSFGKRSLTQWAKDRGFQALLEMVAGIERGAAGDQTPESDALKRIGATDVPAHAIACTAEIGDFFEPLFPTSYVLRNNYYRLLFAQMAELLARNAHALPVVFPPAKGAPEPPVPPGASGEACTATAGATSRPKTDAARLGDFIKNIDWDYWRVEGKLRYLYTWSDELSDVENHAACLAMWADPPAELSERFFQLFRAAIFGNTPNDGTVRFESQLGGLLEPFTTTIQHGEAPVYAEVQQAVVRLLTQPGGHFAPEGFSDAGRPLAELPPGVHVQSPAEKLRAINRSSIHASHAEALARVAAARDVIIMVRPVNEHSTAVIAKGAATKSMHVKGKSADWGPQRALIAVDQAFSKLAGVTRTQSPTTNVRSLPA